jgi:hypothetical protein
MVSVPLTMPEPIEVACDFVLAVGSTLVQGGEEVTATPIFACISQTKT